MQRIERRRTDSVQILAYLAAMLGILAGCGWLVAGDEGAALAVLMPLTAALFVPRLSPHTVMRMQRCAALPSWPTIGLHDMVARLARRAGLETTPSLYMHPSRAISAFTSGNEAEGAIAISRGAVETLAPRELEGVIAHEIAHLAANDTRLNVFSGLMHWATSVASTLGLILCVLAFAMGSGDLLPVWMPWAFALAPMSVSLMQLALSRSREFAADAAAVRLTGDPVGLAAALERLHRQEHGLLRTLLASALPAFRSPLLRTHPPTEQRIERMLAMAGLRQPVASRPSPSWGTPLAQPVRIRVVRPGMRHF